MTDRSIAQEEKRRLILAAAVKVFARKGYHTCRVGDIAEEAGVAHGLLYHYFSSKDEVLETIFRETWAELLEAMRSVGESDAPAAEQLRRVGAILLRSWRRDPELVTVLVREVVRSGDLGSRVVERDEALEAIERIVAQGQERGEFSRGSRPAAREPDRLRRAEGDPHRLGARAAPGRRRGDRARRAHVHGAVRGRAGAASGACANLTR